MFYETTPSCCDISLSNVIPGNKGCFFIWHVDPEISQLGMFHDWQLASILWRSRYPWSLAWQICIVVAIHGSCKLIKSIPFEMNNVLVKPGDGFWCQKSGHLPNCFGLKSTLQLIKQPPVKTLYQSVTYVLATNMQYSWQYVAIPYNVI